MGPVKVQGGQGAAGPKDGSTELLLGWPDLRAPCALAPQLP